MDYPDSRPPPPPRALSPVRKPKTAQQHLAAQRKAEWRARYHERMRRKDEYERGKRMADYHAKKELWRGAKRDYYEHDKGPRRMFEE